MAAKILTVLFLCSVILHGVLCTTLYRTQVTEEDHPDAVCNDGTRPVYYHSNDKRNTDRFIIYLMGGFFCDSAVSCATRCNIISPNLCTARPDPTITVSGILSDDVDENEYLAEHYKVYMHYCTSDMYVGDREASLETGGFHFRGRAATTAVVNALKRLASIDEASEVLVAGTSAGGRGVAFSCDHIQSLLPGVDVKCIVDAAIYYPVMDPFTPECPHFNDVIAEGNEFWNGDIVDFDVDTWWKNFELPLFIGIHMFDTFGVEVYYCGDLSNCEHRDRWGRGLVEVSKDLEENYSSIGLFVPACVGHSLLESDAWYNAVTAGEDRLTYKQTIGNWLTADGPHQVFDDCPNLDTCNSCLSP